MSVYGGITSVGGRDRLRAWALAILLGAGSLCVLFDSLAVATALPAIGRDLGLGPSGLAWVVSLYSVTIGALILLGGRSGDVLGPRRVVVWSLLLCAVGGLVAGLAPTTAVLLV
jgi:MFS family permease